MIIFIQKYKFLFLLGALVIIFFPIVYFSLKPQPKNNQTAVKPPIPTAHFNPPPAVYNAKNNYSSIRQIFPRDQKIGEVGKETIFGADLNYILSIFHSEDIASSPTTLVPLKEEAMPEAINDSVILQSSENLGLIQLTSDIFNNYEKDMDLRGKIVRDLTEKLKAREEKISGALISIWFHNQNITSLPLPQAEVLAKLKIDKIYDQLKSGQITFQEAGQMIKNDSGLEKIDKNYKGNAYYEFTGKSASDAIFTYADIQNTLWNLKVGDISPVVRFPPEGTPLGTNDEEFYAIIKVTKRENPGVGSFADFLKNEKKKYAVTYF